MVKVYLYTSQHQLAQSGVLRSKLIADEIDFEEIDIAVQNRKHPTLSCIPSIIIEKDGVEVGRFEEREVPIAMETVKTFLSNADNIDVSEKTVRPSDLRAQWTQASTIEEKLTLIAKAVGLV